MLSYIVGLVAVGLFLANPISQMLFSSNKSHNRNARIRPQLNESILAVDGPNATQIECPEDSYNIRILSRAPLVVYIENFLSELERRHILDVSEPIWEQSTITNDASTTQTDITVRDSSIALLPRSPTVRCIERRVLAFQGWRSDLYLERLRAQRYAPGGHYGHHFDWSSNTAGWGRVGSMMAWVDDGTLGGGDEVLVGGGTEFPLLRTSRDPRLCSFVECAEKEDVQEQEQEQDGDEKRSGTTFKVVPGNAVYWENFAPDGRGYEETWHAGLPVQQGSKVGLNLWSYGRIE